MSYIDEAHQVVRSAAQTLRELVARAAAEADLAEVADIVRLTSAVSALVPVQSSAEPAGSDVEVTHLSAGEKSDRLPAAERPKALGSQAARARTRAYPEFYRSGEFLVKVAWSKRNRAEYEHRAPRKVLEALVAKLEQRAHASRFTSENLLPLHDAENEEFPSYQVYVCLAWLVSIGAIVREGRTGYLITRKDFRAYINQRWQSATSR